MKKKGRNQLGRRITSIVLAIALGVTSVQITSLREQVAIAATAESMGDKEILSASHIPDSEVRNFYTILANAQKNLEVARNKEDESAIQAAEQVMKELDTMTAGEIVEKYGQDDTYKQQVYGRYLVSYAGKIDFQGLTVKNITGIGWARAASEFNLSSVTITEVPDGEFAYCKMTKIALPDGVTKIGNNAFEACSKLATLTIGEGQENVVDLTKITEVGASAFSGCESVKEVSFADYDTSKPELKIGTKAFASCKKLGEIKLPIKTAANLGANAFEQCAELTKVGLHKDLAYLPNGLFQGAGTSNYYIHFYEIENPDKAEKNSMLPGNITYIGNNCFESTYLWKMDLSTCTKLKKLNQYSFSGATIMELILPESLETIEEQAFGAASIPELVIPEKCTDIKEAAFSRSSLRKITLPDSLTEIQEYTFEECKVLDGNEIKLSPNSKLQKIGKGAFKDCETLNTTAFLKDLKNLTTIEDSAFANCFWYLTSGESNSRVTDVYQENVIVGGLKEVVLPDCVTTLGTSVFEDNFALKRVDLGEGITELPDKSFYISSNIAKLEKVVLSKNIKSIGKSAFENQTRLHTVGTEDNIKEGVVQFGSKLTSIGDRAFAGCGVEKSINVSGIKTYIKSENIKATPDSGSTELMIFDYDYAYDKGNTDNAAKDANYCRVIYVNEDDLLSAKDLPKGTLDEKGKLVGTEYTELHVVAKKAWLSSANISEVKEDSKDLSLDVFAGEYETDTQAYKGRFYAARNQLTEKRYCGEEYADSSVFKTATPGASPYWILPVSSSKIINVGIPGTSENISLTYVFGIKDVSLPDSLREDNLGASAFEKCINLNKVSLSENLTEIKANTFSGAAKEVKYSENNKKYYDYYGLRTIYIPEGMKVIGDGAFQKCYNLYFKESSTSALGTSLETIGNNAFTECVSLETMKFPTSLLSVGNNAFAQCSVRNTGDEDYKADYEFADGSKYTYYWNYEKYGRRTTKTGLRKLDFSAAKNLESLGTAVFKQCNVTDVQLSNSPLKKVSDSMFEQCSYLRNISFGDKVESVEQNVLKDVINLTTVSIPASATVKGNAIGGAFGKVALDRENGGSQADPTLTLSYKENEEVVIPVNGSVRLPINAFNKDVLNGSVKVMIVDGSTETDILGKKVKGLRAELDTTKEPYSFVLYGEDYVKDPVTVKIEAGVGFKYANTKDTIWTSTHTFKYRVSVLAVPTEKVTLSAAEDTNVKKNPSMYGEINGKKALYVPVGSSAATNGIKVTANIEPADNTDEVSWVSSDEEVVEVSDMQYEKGSGLATAVVKCKKPGDAIVTIKSGTVTDQIAVTGQISVASGGISCTTGGSLLNTSITNNASFGIAIGDSDRIDISVDYGKTDFDDNTVNTFGEKTVITSSDETVVTVSPDGTFKAVGEGVAVITIQGQASGTKLQFTLNVSSDKDYTPLSVAVTGPEEVNVGESIKLSASVIPSQGSQEVTWSVASGEKVASVDAQGNVTGLARGEATIVATSAVKDTIKSKAFKVVVKAPIKELSILDKDVSIEIGKTMEFTKTTKADAVKGFRVTPSDTTDAITWTSNNESVLQIVKGTNQSVSVKALSVGTAVLTGTAASGVTGSVTITVIEKVSSITVDKEVTLNVGKTHTLVPQKVPATATEVVTYTYTSSNPKVATVDANGVIRAVAPGSASITAKTNTNKSASCQVTVKQPANKLTLYLNRPSTKTVYMAKGQVLNLNPKMSPENTTDRLSYKSNKPKIVAVTTSGSVTAKKKGSAVITIKADSGKKISLKVIVSNKQVKAKKVIIKAPKTIKRKKTVKIGVSLKSAKSTDTLTFVSNKPNVAEIDSYGYLKAKKKGTVKITVTASSGKKATKTIKVK